ncbi:hypothetical protein SERLA73DRAFT_179768 [Serpula lacrymans var. lacrymans S7.3]|uniref:Uncharacterized protein n=2 Tax=Serpula lacrymans var. lacrymans TaxID=341189 RepID=F8PUD0_SERL3|nr:uncharacterized protein SERLADRAFT_465030 [Serpula lacrymans var. lacrymans S7.9]EGN99650.1 hypothetical protein SERLA73DRAFT_179768 [Serpula lacrymans var. lacrymans S7.3]EGO25213.1 hypothetical protein SERLADRAFT_465030 [Serpula lacrymans var. lacrymans S7.9]
MITNVVLIYKEHRVEFPKPCAVFLRQKALKWKLVVLQIRGCFPKSTYVWPQDHLLRIIVVYRISQNTF